MILAAGFGSRLRPLTAHLPKPLVPIRNHPLLWYIITQLNAAGIDEIIVNLHYRGERIRDWLGRGHQFGVEVTYSEETTLLGSAGGVRRVRDFFGQESALIIHGDVLFDVDLDAVIQYHHSRSAQATLVLHPEHQRYAYGKIRMNAHGEIGQFVHHRAPWVSGPLIDTVFTGVQIIAPEVLDAIPDTSTGFLTTDVYPALLTPASRLYGYLMQGYWSDIGTPRHYWETNMDVMRGRVRSTSHPQPQGRTQQRDPQQHGRVCPPVALPSTLDIPASAVIGPDVVMGDGCSCAENVHLLQSVLWPGVRLERGVTIEQSIVMNDVTIPKGSHFVRKVISSKDMYDL